MDETQPHSKLSQEEQVPANPPSRKRQIDSDNDSDGEPLPKRARLTRKNLALFDKMGKKKTSDPTDDLKSTKTTSTTTSGFADKAYKNHILPPRDSKRPTHTDDIRRRHAVPRDTASPPESEYERYADRIEEAGNEATVVIESSKLLKEYDDKGYRRAFNRSFTNVPPNAGYNDGLSAPQPDFIEGLKKGEFRPFPVADHIPGAAIYKDDPYSVTLPQIAGEWKGPDGSMKEAELQSAYDGAALVHARNQALAYMGKSDPPGHAAITTFTTDGANLNMYAHYAIPSEEDEDTLEYHQYKYASTNIKDSYQGYKDGRKGLRNAQDYAKEQSYTLKDQLKEHWKRQRSTVHPIAEEEPLPMPEEAHEEASADEALVLNDESALYDEPDEGDFEIIEPNPCQPTPAASAASRKASRSHASSGDGDRKRKASPSRAPLKPRRSKAKPYWVIDEQSGEYYHKHSDGTISWFDDDDNED